MGQLYLARYIDMKGGKINGAGRKPCTDKKQQMTTQELWQWSNNN